MFGVSGQQVQRVRENRQDRLKALCSAPRATGKVHDQRIAEHARHGTRQGRDEAIAGEETPKDAMKDAQKAFIKILKKNKYLK